VATFGDGVRMMKPSGVGRNDAIFIVRIQLLKFMDVITL
jgi:hypothetical protein